MSDDRFHLLSLTDRQLLDRLLSLHRSSAELMADLLCHLAEVERRDLHLREGCSSLFTYAVQVLHCTEDEAAKRIHAARAGRRFPVVFELVARGELTLTAVNMLAPHLEEASHLELLERARHKTKRELEELIARIAPRPDAVARLARLPERPAAMALRLTPAAAPQTTAAATLTPPAPASPPADTRAPGATATETSASSVQPAGGPRAAAPGPARATAAVARPDPGRLEPLSPGRYRLQCTLSAEAQRAILEIRDLTRHTNPRGDLATLLERALFEHLERLESRKLAKLKTRERRERPARHLCSVAPDAAGAETRACRSLSLTEAEAPTPAPQPSAGDSDTRAQATARPLAPRSNAPSTRPARATPVQPAPEPVPAPPATSRARPTTGKPPTRRRRPARADLRAIVERDGARCTYVSPDGRRCTETACIETHHDKAFALGGETAVPNLTLRCRAHNAYQARLDFGAEHIAASVRRRRQRHVEATP